MTSLRQIEANRRNARLSTGPVTEEGKRRSRQNALRHGLTAETVIDALEDAQDYAAFEMAVTADYDAQSAVERELVLRLASLLWRLRRATAIESGLFKIQGKAADCSFGNGDTLIKRRTSTVCYRDLRSVGVQQRKGKPLSGADSLSTDPKDPFEHLTLSYLRLTNLPERSARPAQSLRVHALAPSTSDAVCPPGAGSQGSTERSRFRESAPS